MRCAKPSRSSSVSLSVSFALSLLGAVPVVQAAAPVPAKIANAPTAKAPGPVRSAMDPVLLNELTAFLREYDHALETGDRAYLSAHTVWPLPYTATEYNMEAKAQSKRLATVDALLAGTPPLREGLRLPKAVLPATPQALAQQKQGAQQCDKKGSASLPDFTQGAPALTFRPDGSVTLAYLALPCDAETHIVTWTMSKRGGSWRLAGRSVRIGVK